MDIVFIDEVGFAKDPATLDRENQIFKDYLGDPVSMCERIAELEAERDRVAMYESWMKRKVVGDSDVTVWRLLCREYPYLKEQT